MYSTYNDAWDSQVAICCVVVSVSAVCQTSSLVQRNQSCALRCSRREQHKSTQWVQTFGTSNLERGGNNAWRHCCWKLQVKSPWTSQRQYIRLAVVVVSVTTTTREPFFIPHMTFTCVLVLSIIEQAITQCLVPWMVLGFPCPEFLFVHVC